jgi:hypothetical protein
MGPILFSFVIVKPTKSVMRSHALQGTDLIFSFFFNFSSFFFYALSQLNSRGTANKFILSKQQFASLHDNTEKSDSQFIW